MAQPQKTWKEAAGRTSGPDGYQIGDLIRTAWSKVSGQHASAPGNNAAANVTDDDRAMLDIKVQRDQLLGHKRRFERQLAKDEEAARSLVASGKKTLAMVALRKKKQHQQLVVDVEQHLLKLEELLDNIEMAKIQKETVDALAAGVKTLKRVQQSIGDAAYVEQLLDERDEAMAAQQEISDALSGAGIAVDDAEALAELEKLEAAHAAELLSQAKPAAAAGSTAAGEVAPAATTSPGAEEVPAAVAAEARSEAAAAPDAGAAAPEEAAPTPSPAAVTPSKDAQPARVPA
eukprot:TRINITY_DN9375_c0_g1_i1.p1 TRINITY_DN9375_c0_g1~~TRINITY_DN9375_c0_g1_i1.p1  ORF type:complete len:289 (+),score=105.02 TRINITY_DN9375_c0_g1_i1:164-1030(+)